MRKCEIIGIGTPSTEHSVMCSYGSDEFKAYKRLIFKDPKTDNGNFRKSQKGMCYVYKNNDDVLYKDELTIQEQESCKDNLLQVIFKYGKLMKEYLLKEIRERLHGKF